MSARPDADRESSGSRVDFSRSPTDEVARTEALTSLSASPAEDAGPTCQAPNVGWTGNRCTARAKDGTSYCRRHQKMFGAARRPASGPTPTPTCRAKDEQWVTCGRSLPCPYHGDDTAPVPPSSSLGAATATPTSTERWCGELFEPHRPKTSYICNRERGHSGEHEAWGGDVICWRWPASPPVGGATREPTQRPEHRYSVFIGWSQEDEEFVATSPEWPGLSGMSRMRKMAFAALLEAITVALRAAHEDGEKPPVARLLDYFPAPRSPVEAGAPEEATVLDCLAVLQDALGDEGQESRAATVRYAESLIVRLAARVSQLEATVAGSEKQADAAVELGMRIAGLWQAVYEDEEERTTILRRVRAALERPERASSLTVPGSSQDVAVQALTAARLSAEQERDALRAEVQMQNPSGTTANGRQQEPELKGESSIRVGQKWRDTRLQGHQTVRVSAYTEGAKVVTVYSDRWWGTGLRQFRVTTLRKHFRPVA